MRITAAHWTVANSLVHCIDLVSVRRTFKYPSFPSRNGYFSNLERSIRLHIYVPPLSNVIFLHTVGRLIEKVLSGEMPRDCITLSCLSTVGASRSSSPGRFGSPSYSRGKTSNTSLSPSSPTFTQRTLSQSWLLPQIDNVGAGEAGADVSNENPWALDHDCVPLDFSRSAPPELIATRDSLRQKYFIKSNSTASREGARTGSAGKTRRSKSVEVLSATRDSSPTDAKDVAQKAIKKQKESHQESNDDWLRNDGIEKSLRPLEPLPFKMQNNETNNQDGNEVFVGKLRTDAKPRRLLLSERLAMTAPGKRTTVPKKKSEFDQVFFFPALLSSAPILSFSPVK